MNTTNLLPGNKPTYSIEPNSTCTIYMPTSKTYREVPATPLRLADYPELRFFLVRCADIPAVAAGRHKSSNSFALVCGLASTVVLYGESFVKLADAIVNLLSTMPYPPAEHWVARQTERLMRRYDGDTMAFLRHIDSRHYL